MIPCMTCTGNSKLKFQRNYLHWALFILTGMRIYASSSKPTFMQAHNAHALRLAQIALLKIRLYQL